MQKDRYFPTQISGEKVFLLIRRHWIYFAIMAILFTVLLAPVAGIAVYWSVNPDIFSGILGNFLIIFLSMYTLSMLGLALWGFVNYYLDVYIVTDERIVDIRQKSFFKRDIAELHLRQVQDVDAKVDGFLHTMLHYGDVYIQTAGEKENFVFEDVPNPYTLARKIAELNEEQIEAGNPSGDEDGDNSGHLVREKNSLRKFQSEKTPVVKAEAANERGERWTTEHQLEEAEGGIKWLEESYTPKTEEEFEKKLKEKKAMEVDKPVEANENNSENENQSDFFSSIKDSGELSEGEEISVNNDKNR